MAKHRDDTYFSFHELNRMIRKELDAANDRPFQKMEGSRRSVFEQTERHMLHPLPLRPYEIAEFKEARVAPDYHVEYKGNFYSVPYQFVKDTVEIRATAKTVEVIHRGRRIASHSRIFPNGKHKYNTIPDHMPETHRFQAEWTPERLLQWAGKIGQETSAYLEILLSRRQHPEQSFRLCLGILKFADKYGKASMEKACYQARVLKRYSYKDFKILIENLPSSPEEERTLPSHQNIRGREYYRQVVNGGVADAD